MDKADKIEDFLASDKSWQEMPEDITPEEVVRYMRGEDVDEILAKLPKAGLYMRCNDDGFWNCGYDKTVHHNGDRDLYTALKGLYEKLKDFGYDI